MVRKIEKIKRVFLAVSFCLLMSSTATAQDAVLLWEKVLAIEIKEGTLSENSQWTVLKVLPTDKQCGEAQRQILEVRKAEYIASKDSKPEMEAWITPYKAVTVQWGSEPSLISNIFYCLPDTIDPRKR